MKRPGVRLLLGIGMALSVTMALAQGTASEQEQLDALHTLVQRNSAQALTALRAASTTLGSSASTEVQRGYLSALIDAGFDTGDGPLVTTSIERLEALASEKGDGSARVLAACARARQLGTAGQSRQAITLLEDLKSDGLGASDAQAQWMFHLTLGTIQGSTGQFEAGLANILRSLELARTLPHLAELAQLRSQVHLAMIYMEMRNPDKAGPAIRDGLTIAERLDAKQARGWLQLHRGNLASEQGHFDVVQAAYALAAQAARESGLVHLQATALNNLGDIHLRRKAYALAEPLMREAMAAYEKAGNPGGAALSRANVGFALMGQGKIEAGVTEVQAGLRFLREADARTTEEGVLGELSRMYEEAGRYREAIETTRAQQALARELFQIEREKAVGALQEQFDTAQRQRQIEQLAQENRVKDAELQTRRLQQIALSVGGALLLLGGGFVLMLYRRTRRANAGLAVARQEAEHALREKNMFLATASHDLRQPVHAMALMVEALGLRNQNPALTPLVTDLKQSMTALNQQFNALLDLSRLETGAWHPVAVPVDLPALLRELVRTFREQATSAGLELRLRLPAQGAVVRVDPVLLRQSLSNLVHNALRYTREGGLLVGARRRGGDWQVEVWDTGIGIAAEEEEQVFNPYFRTEQAWRVDNAGHGLGLAVVARSVRLMAATCGFRSKPGRGSRFWIRLAACDDAADTPTSAVIGPSVPAPFKSLSGRCLVLDDDRQVLAAWQVLLESWGVSVRAATTEAEAHAQLDTGFAPQAIFCDQRLHAGHNGFAVLKSLLARCPGASGAMVSGELQSPELTQAEDEGYLVLAKPLDPVALHALLERCFAETAQTAL